MTIKLINCKPKLEAMGIYMEQTGSGDLLYQRLSEKVLVLAWEYNFQEDMLIVEVEEGTVIPDMSEFGELVEDGY